jgi:hypothetical protein
MPGIRDGRIIYCQTDMANVGANSARILRSSFRLSHQTETIRMLYPRQGEREHQERAGVIPHLVAHTVVLENPPPNNPTIDIRPPPIRVLEPASLDLLNLGPIRHDLDDGDRGDI